MRPAVATTAPRGVAALLGILLLSGTAGAAPLAVSVGGPADQAAYLPVHAAAALGTFEAEGVEVTLRRAKHPTGALDLLRNREVAVAVTTLDQAIRGGFARGTPVRLLLAQTRAPAAALLVPASAAGPPGGVADLRGKRVGVPGPGTTGHLLLAALLRLHRIEPWQVDTVSLGGAALAGRLAAGDLAGALVEEPWVSRALAAGTVRVLLDLRDPAASAQALGGAFHEVVTLVRVGDKEGDQKAMPSEAALAALARALIRVQAWLASVPPSEVAARLPRSLVGDAARFAERLAPLQAAYAPDGRVTEAGLQASLRVLREGSPWPVSVKLGPRDLIEPAFVEAARARLGSPPPPP